MDIPAEEIPAKNASQNPKKTTSTMSTQVGANPSKAREKEEEEEDEERQLGTLFHLGPQSADMPTGRRLSRAVAHVLEPLAAALGLRPGANASSAARP